MRVYINGRIVPQEQAVVPVFDRGFMLGDGVFETMRAYCGRAFMLEEHMARLSASAEAIGITLPMTGGELLSAVHETIKANELADAYVRVTLTRGEGPQGLDVSLCTKPTLVIVARELQSYTEERYRRGLALITARTRRTPAESLDPAIKSLNFLNNIQARREVSAAGADEALMLNIRGEVAECTVSNVFFAGGGVLHTPSLDCGILAGVTRSLVMELARGMGIDVREGRYMPDDIAGAEEIFVTNSTMEVMPVCSLDGKTFAAGEMARRLRASYKDEVRRRLCCE